MYAMTAAASECLNARIDTRVCATLERQPCANAAVQSPLIQHFDGFPWLAAIHIECDELPNACMVCIEFCTPCTETVRSPVQTHYICYRLQIVQTRRSIYGYAQRTCLAAAAVNITYIHVKYVYIRN